MIVAARANVAPLVIMSSTRSKGISLPENTLSSIRGNKG